MDPGLHRGGTAAETRGTDDRDLCMSVIPVSDWNPGDNHRGANAPRQLHKPHNSLTLRNRSAFAITDTELNVMAALAMIGLKRIPKKG